MIITKIYGWLWSCCVVRLPRCDEQFDELARIRADVARELFEFLEGMFEFTFILLLIVLDYVC